jgi:hypothetical protein
MPVLLSDQDRSSFLVPCYGFTDRHQAEAYVCRQQFRPADPQPVWGDQNVYVPRLNLRDQFTTNDLIDRPRYVILRRQLAPKPANAYNVTLLVEGPRQFNHHQNSDPHPKWWGRLTEGDRDCYTVWNRLDGRPLGSAILRQGANRLYAARAGRGVRYSRISLFHEDGSLKGTLQIYWFVECSVADADPTRDDLLRVRMSHTRQTWLHDPQKAEPQNQAEESPDPNLDSRWHDLIARARQGFNKHCHPVPPSMEAWRQLFLDQHREYEVDAAQLVGDQFAYAIHALTWEEALRRVEKPWQLAVVAKWFIDWGLGRQPRPEANGASSIGERVNHMVTQHTCTPERRQELQQMVRDYVEPAHSRWDQPPAA